MSDGESSDDETQKLVQEQNKKSKSGGFYALGLSAKTVKAAVKKGYKIPTPIQRKTIPLLLDKRDVVAMARTGSGKTAAFLLPMIELLKEHSVVVGIRCLVLSPTRELAIQTMKFAKDFSRGRNLRIALILGGDSMSEQFQSLHDNPDIVIATPGRLVHLIHEMNLKLPAVEILICDEADRLFEMGFADQLSEICTRLPKERQTTLFSATLPRSVVEFARAGLREPVLVRLDVESKLSDGLSTVHLRANEENKWAVLFHLMEHVITTATEQTVIFFPTKHHVEYAAELFSSISLPCASIYSSLDQTARKIAAAKFYHKKVNVLLVTDIAARGIDVPLLDNVINFNFPQTAKLYVHRVGRVARAGKTGTAYSLIAGDELPFLFDLYLYLGRNVTFSTAGATPAGADQDCLGVLPQYHVDTQNERIASLHKMNCLLDASQKTYRNGHKHYVRSRGHPAAESVVRAKEVPVLASHPLFPSDAALVERDSVLAQLRTYRGRTTIFEVNKTDKNECQGIMKRKREIHEKFKSAAKVPRLSSALAAVSTEDGATEGEMGSVFVQVEKPSVDTGYIPYTRPGNQDAEDRALSLGFERDVGDATFDLAGDDVDMIKKQKARTQWDQKKKKFVKVEKGGKEKTVRAEDGSKVRASYKSGRYKEWVSKAKKSTLAVGEKEEGGKGGGPAGRRRGWHYTKEKVGKSELKGVDTIIKARKVKAKNRAQHMKKGGGKGKAGGGGGGFKGKGGGGGFKGKAGGGGGGFKSGGGGGFKKGGKMGKRK